MIQRKSFLGLIAVTMFMISFAVAETFNHDHGTAEKAFRQADIINDGRIDTGEFDMYHMRVFSILDTNADKKVTRTECAGSCFTPRPGDELAADSGVVYYKFDAIDLDMSGELAEYEYVLYARERFDQYDKNDDGFINLDEFCTFYSLSIPCTFTAATDKMEE